MRAALCLTLLSATIAVASDAKPTKPKASLLAKVRDGLKELGKALAPYIGTSTQHGEAGRAWPSNDSADVQPVWAEPGGHIPPLTLRGVTCQDGNVSFMLPTPFTAWLWGLR